MKDLFQRMSSKRSIILAWFLFVLCILGALTHLGLVLSRSSGQLSLFDLSNVLVWAIVVPLTFSILGLLVITRQPGNRVGWLIVIAGLAAASPLSTILENQGPPSNMTPGLWLLVWIDNYSWLPLIFPIFLIPLHFPTGLPPSRRWRWVNLLALGLVLLLLVSGSFITEIGPMDAEWVVPNPIGFIPVEFFEGPFLIFWGLGLLTMFLGSLAALFVRYRRASSVERQQIKWLLYAGAFYLIVYGLAFFLIPPDSSGGWGNIWLVLGMLTIPVAIAIAITRYRLYDIDLIIRRTLVYTVLTAMLALVYFGIVILLERVLRLLVGGGGQIATVISTLAIAALFTPLRRRVQEVIDRRFYRQKYDAQQALAQFAATARSETDLEALTDQVVSIVRDTVQPESLSLWLREAADR